MGVRLSTGSNSLDSGEGLPLSEVTHPNTLESSL